MKILGFIFAFLFSVHSQAMSCHVETDYIYGVYKKVSGVCDEGYRFKIEGPAIGLKFEKTDFFGISCTSDQKAGSYIGIGIDIGLAKGYTGSAFMLPQSSYSYRAPKMCFVGGLEDPALLYVGFSITQLTISAPTKSSIEWARHIGLE